MLQDCYYVLLIQLGIIMLSERMKRVCMADAAPKFGRIIMCTLLGGDAHRIGNVTRQIIEFQRCAVSVYEICHNAKTAESVVVFVGFCVDVLDTYLLLCRIYDHLCVGYISILQLLQVCRRSDYAPFKQPAPPPHTYTFLSYYIPFMIYLSSNDNLLSQSMLLHTRPLVMVFPLSFFT